MENILDFDCNFYRFVYSDLKHMTDDELKNHYDNFGKNENRICTNILPNDFDVNAYGLIHKDLYSIFTKKAEREYKCIVKNSKIEINDREGDKNLIIHYCLHGYLERRNYKYNINEHFDFNNYKLKYPKLKNSNNIEIIEHYTNNEYNEEVEEQYKELDISSLPKNFNYKIYLFLNDDLELSNEKESIIHYLTIGVYENRKINFN